MTPAAHKALWDDAREYATRHPVDSATPAWDIPTWVRTSGQVFGDRTQHETATHLRNDLYGAGPLQQFLDDPTVTDVLVHGDRLWVDQGHGPQEIAQSPLGQGQSREWAVRLAARAGTRLDDAHPITDAQLPDGSRFHAVLSPVSDADATMSIRVFRTRHATLHDLTRTGMIPRQWARACAQAVTHRASLLISGGTGAGKTTLLSALLSHVPHTERIITLEDSREIATNHPHVVALQAKPANVEGAGAVTLSNLVHASLRMRPDRLMLGECRGPEVRDLLMAFNTGHSGGAATIHANSVTDVPARLIALGALAGMDPVTTSLQAVSAVNAIVHVARTPAGHRYIKEWGVLRVGHDSLLTVAPFARWDGDTTPKDVPLPAGVERPAWW